MTVDRTITRIYITSEVTEKIYCDYFTHSVRNLGIERTQSYKDWINYIIDTVDDEMLINEYGFKIEVEKD